MYVCIYTCMCMLIVVFADSSLYHGFESNHVCMYVCGVALAWHRVRAANQLTDSGPAWYDMVSRYNSGTYNNQYMVLDTKRFKAKNALQSNTLFVVEQIPGLMAGADVTEQLERGYWSSYNGKS